MDQTSANIIGQEHWTTKGDVKLYLWEKPAPTQQKRGTLVFVHGSSMASTPSFDLQLPGKPDSSLMNWFARRGFDTWCADMEGYGRSRSTVISVAILPMAPTTLPRRPITL